MADSFEVRGKNQPPRITALAGGVGGAKLAFGLAQSLAPESLTVVVNTGDDFTHLGLRICPDLDTVCYTLAGLANPSTGWGRAGESWTVLQTLQALGAPTWFNVGDQDLATHLERTRRLSEGAPLSLITRDFCATWGVRHAVLPVTDDRLETWVETTDQGWLPFQEYFVHQQCAPKVTSFRFAGCETARPAPGVLEAIQAADWVIVCPSNPWVSIGPILSLPAIAGALQKKQVVAVSPIVGGKAIKGPAAKMFAEMGISPSALAVAAFYRELLSGFVLDQVDQGQADDINGLGMETLITNTVMQTRDDRVRLADEILAFCSKLGGRYRG